MKERERVQRSRKHIVNFLIGCLGGFFLSGNVVWAQTEPSLESVSDSSPHRTVMEFLAACEEGEYQEAATHLYLSEEQAEDAEVLSFQLKTVIELFLKSQIEVLSDTPLGNLDDTFPERDILGILPSQTEPNTVYLERELQSDGTMRWVFPFETVQHIERWFQESPVESPKSSLESFLALCGRQDFQGATRYLDFSIIPEKPDTTLLTKHLCEVLQKYPDKVKPDLVSTNPGGSLSDGFAPDEEEIFLLPGVGENLEPIHLKLEVFEDKAYWVFSPYTVSRIDLLYAALAQNTSETPPSSAPAEESNEAVGEPSSAPPSSPRGSLTSYFEAARDGNYEEAANYLNIPDDRVKDGPGLARRLKAVLDRHLWVEMDKVSPETEGNTEDGYPRYDELGKVPGPTGTPETVYIEKIQDSKNDFRWVFSQTTVERIDVWYQTLPDRWALDLFPSWLLLPGPFELLYWQWLALFLLIPISIGLGLFLTWLTRSLLARLVSHTENEWDDAILERTTGPLNLAWALVSVYFFLPWLSLYEPAEKFVQTILRTLLFVAFFWSLLRSVDIVRQVIMGTKWAKENPGSRSLVPLGARVIKVVVVIMSIIAILSEFGYPVASLIAGLGIGGLAFALAAQKTVENLFGAFSIGVDQPFREGDFVKIDGFVGTVEAIGLRSTRVRTLDRTVISLPNGKLADTKVESYAVRDRIRLNCTLGLVYETSVSQMRTVIEELEKTLRAHSKIWPDAVIVRFASFGDFSLNIDAIAWFQTSDWGEFQEIRQNIFLQFMEVVENAGTSFAFPSQTIYMANEGEKESPPSKAIEQKV